MSRCGWFVVLRTARTNTFNKDGDDHSRETTGRKLRAVDESTTRYRDGSGSGWVSGPTDSGTRLREWFHPEPPLHLTEESNYDAVHAMEHRARERRGDERLDA